MNDEQFTKRFKLVSEVKDAMATKADIAELRQQIDSVYQLLDTNIKEHDRQEDERAAMSSQLTRHEAWIQQLASSTDTKLRYE